MKLIAVLVLTLFSQILNASPFIDEMTSDELKSALLDYKRCSLAAQNQLAEESQREVKFIMAKAKSGSDVHFMEVIEAGGESTIYYLPHTNYIFVGYESEMGRKNYIGFKAKVKIDLSPLLFGEEEYEISVVISDRIFSGIQAFSRRCHL